jgi:hypothetical protein
VTAATHGPIDGATLWTLRHTHASACHDASLTLREGARRLGHGQQTELLHYRT